MKVTFLRHGETDWNIARRIQGTKPVPINANGIRQIREVCRSFSTQSECHCATVITSPLLRARQSAEICGKILRAPVEIEPDFRERCFGDLEGRTRAEINLQFGIRDIESFDGCEYGIEPVLELDKRLMRGIGILKASARFQEENVLVVTHGSVIRWIAKLYGVNNPDLVPNDSLQTGVIPNGAYIQLYL